MSLAEPPLASPLERQGVQKIVASMPAVRQLLGNGMSMSSESCVIQRDVISENTDITQPSQAAAWTGADKHAECFNALLHCCSTIADDHPNPKGALNEALQSVCKPADRDTLPVETEWHGSGPFTCSVRVFGTTVTAQCGSVKTKKAAEREACSLALQHLRSLSQS